MKEKIQNAINKAIKERDEKSLGPLRMVLAAVVSKEKEKRYKASKRNSDLDEKGLNDESKLMDEEIVEIIYSEIKKRKDAFALYEKGGRQELADKEKKEVEILQKYLPEQMSEDEVKKLVEETITKTGAKEIKDMGRVMAELMPRVKGKADAGFISKTVKELLTPKNARS